VREGAAEEREEERRRRGKKGKGKRERERERKRDRAGGIRGGDREPVVASTRSDAHEKRGKQEKKDGD
jgi:hypothetical protein